MEVWIKRIIYKIIWKGYTVDLITQLIENLNAKSKIVIKVN